MPDSSWAATMAQGLIHGDHKAHERPSLTTEQASQPRGRHLGSAESSARVTAGSGYEAGGGGCLCVCTHVFFTQHWPFFHLPAKALPRLPQANRRTLVKNSVECGLFSRWCASPLLEKGLPFPSAQSNQAEAGVSLHHFTWCP